MVANKLTFNLTKSNVIIINPKNSPIGTKPNTVSIHQHFLPRLSTVTAAKCLNVVLDDGLSFKTHINMLTKKLSRAVGVLSKLNCFSISLHCLAYTMEFFLPILNMEYWPEVLLTNLIVIK